MFLLSCCGLIFFTGGSEWKVIAERLGFNQAYIRCFDSRYRNPLEVVLSCCHLTVGELYDILVECELPVLADFLQERRSVTLVIILYFKGVTSKCYGCAITSAVTQSNGRIVGHVPPCYACILMQQLMKKLPSSQASIFRRGQSVSDGSRGA